MFQIRHFVFIFNFETLVSDRLGGQVSEQKDAGTLDNVEKPIKNFGEIADTAFCIVTNDIFF